MPDAPQTSSPVAYGASDVGRRRERNEDAFLVDLDLGLFVVADGMGGHAGGDTASGLAVATIQQYLRDVRDEEPEAFASGSADASVLGEKLREAVETACRAIFRTAQADPALTGMGTTVTSALVRDRCVLLAHVGDTRCYLVREGCIEQLSEDHSLVNEQVKAGTITLEEARTSRLRNVITRSVGYEEEVTVDLLRIEGRPGDRLVLCCDGLTNLVDDEEILAVIHREPLHDVPRKLIQLANARGGDDNITVVVVQLS
jgi:protein phosphatase